MMAAVGPPVMGTCWATAAAKLPPALSPEMAMRSGSTEYWSSTSRWRKCFTTRYTSSKGTGKWCAGARRYLGKIKKTQQSTAIKVEIKLISQFLIKS